jgi:glc operon protein GlcG
MGVNLKVGMLAYFLSRCAGKMHMVLKLAEAKKIIDGAIAKARELKVEVSVAVCNPEGRIIALNRMDGVRVADASHEAIGKAIASALWGAPSHECKSRADLRHTAMVVGEGLPVIRSRGGLPIRRDDIVEGACGVSGANDLSQDKNVHAQGLLRCDPFVVVDRPVNVSNTRSITFEAK